MRDPKIDHAHASSWFSKSNMEDVVVEVRNAVKADIQPNRHTDMANYLYVDGHVDVIAWRADRGMDRGRINFAEPEYSF